MKRALTLTIAVVLVAGIGTPAQAAPGDVPARVPDYFSGTTTYVYPRTTVTIGCIDFGAMFFGSPTAMSMLSYTLNDLKGKRLAYKIEIRDAVNSEFITAGAGGQNITQVTTRAPNDHPGAEITYYQLKPKVVGLLRLGYAAWGGMGTCFVATGGFGVGMGFIGLPSSKARFAYPSDFAGGAALGTAKGGVAALQSYSRSAKGYMFSIFRPGSGVAKVKDHKGKTRYDSSTSATAATNVGSATFAEVSTGTWTYSLDATVTQSRSPVLWTMELAK